MGVNLSGHHAFCLVGIGGGAYWAGRAAARPLFSPCGHSRFFARPLFVVENIYFVVIQQCRGL